MKLPSFFTLLAFYQASSVEGFAVLPRSIQTPLSSSTNVKNDASSSIGYAKISTSKHMGIIVNRIKKRVAKRAVEKAKEKLRQRLFSGIIDKGEDFVIDKLIGRMEGPMDSSVKILEEIDDLLFTAMMTVFPQLLIDDNNNAKTSEDFTNTITVDGDEEEAFYLGWERTGDGFDDWEKDFIAAEIIEVTNGVVVKRIRTDAIYGPPEAKDDVLGTITTTPLIFPMNDRIFFFDSKEECDDLIKDTKLNGKSAKGATPDPYPEQKWEGEKSSDLNFSRFFFNGIGAAILEQQVDESSNPDLGPIEIDLDFMKDLAVREGFRAMGVKIYFDADQKPTGIYDSAKETMHKPGDEGWEGAKFLARTSAFTLLTAREHLFQSHLLTSNYLSLASIKHLPPSHPIRRLINVITFRTNRVNDGAFQQLVPELGFLHRALGFEYESMLTIFDNSFQNNNSWQPFPRRNMRPELMDMSNNGKLPYHTEAVQYYDIVEKFIGEWLDEAGDAATDSYAQDFYNEIRDSTIGQKYELPEFAGVSSMIDVLSQGLFVVTCYHEIIGTVIDYTNDPTFVGFRVVEDGPDGKPPTEVDIQSFMIQLLITASTGLTVPMLMKPYKNYFSKDGAPRWEKRKWNAFIDDLEEQSKKVRKSDRKKEVQFLFMDPKRFESAISV